MTFQEGHSGGELYMRGWKVVKWIAFDVISCSLMRCSRLQYHDRSGKGDHGEVQYYC
jgi:hypothetical protein